MFNAIAIVLAIVVALAFVLCIIASWFAKEPCCNPDQSILDAGPQWKEFTPEQIQWLLEENSRLTRTEGFWEAQAKEKDTTITNTRKVIDEQHTQIKGLCEDLRLCGVEIVKLRQYIGQLEQYVKALRTSLANTTTALHETKN